jgi:hypothetical protein
MKDQPTPPAAAAAPGTDSAHFENGVRCGFCGKAWTCDGYQRDYQAVMRARNAARDQQWAAVPPTESAPVVSAQRRS